MSLYPDPLDSILASIKSTSSIDLIKTEYTFGTPTPVDVDAKGTNTTLLITAKDVNSTYDGAVTVRYTRLDLADIPTLIGGNAIQIPTPTTTLDVATALNTLYGTNFTTDDIESSPVTLSGDATDVTLTAKSTSLGWIGNVVFSVSEGRYLLYKEVTDVNLSGLSYADPYQSKPFGSSLTYHLDFSAQFAAVSILTVNNLDLGSLAQVMTAITGSTWVTDVAGRYSLKGTTGVFQGKTVDYPEANDSYDNVFVALLGTDCQGFSGRIFLHYNDPES